MIEAEAEAGKRWRLERLEGRKGRPLALRPVIENPAAKMKPDPGTPRQTGIFEEGISAARVPPAGANAATRNPAADRASDDPAEKERAPGEDDAEDVDRVTADDAVEIFGGTVLGSPPAGSLAPDGPAVDADGPRSNWPEAEAHEHRCPRCRRPWTCDFDHTADVACPGLLTEGVRLCVDCWARERRRRERRGNHGAPRGAGKERGEE